MQNLPDSVKAVLERITKKKATSAYTPPSQSGNTSRRQSGKNTRVEYLYADSEGYKAYSKVHIFKGTLTDRQTQKMLYKIMDFGFFPKPAGLKPLYEELAKLTGRVDTEGYHDITSWETTDDAPTEKDNIHKFFGRVMSTPVKR